MIKVKINSIKDLKNNEHLIPKVILDDIYKRINDWLGSGGSNEDEYIKNQFRVAERVINR